MKTQSIPGMLIYGGPMCSCIKMSKNFFTPHQIKIILLFLSIFIILPETAFALSEPAPAGNHLPLAASICIRKAQSMMEKGRIHKAIVLLENFKELQRRVDKRTAEKKGYTHYYINFLLGNCYLARSHDDRSDNAKLKKKYTEKAFQSYREALKKKPDLSPAWLNLAKCAYELNNMAEAAEAFLKGYETSKEKKAIYLYYASICYAGAGDTKNALKYARYLTAAYPLEPKWWKALSNLYLNNNDLKQGLAALISYSFLAPLKDNEISLAADLYLSLNIPSKAAFYYEKLLQKKIDRKKINKIVYAYMENFQVNKALKWINKGLVLYKSDKDLLKQKVAANALLNFNAINDVVK